MAGKKVTHTEDWWELGLAPSHVLRCTAYYKRTGGRCRREALAGTNVCKDHGGLIPAVQASAATRIGMSVDDAVKRLLGMLDDPAVEARDKVKVLHDLLDRGGLGATSKLMVGTQPGDPIDTLFRDLLGDPAALAVPSAQSAPALDPALADEFRAMNEAADGGRLRADVVDAVIVEDDDEDLLGDVSAVLAAAPPRGRRGRAAGSRGINSDRTPKHIREGLERLT